MSVTYEGIHVSDMYLYHPVLLHGGGEEIYSMQSYEGGGANNMVLGQAEKRKRLST